MKHVFAVGLIFAASFAQAHPHIFVKTGLRLVADNEGRLNGIEVTWTYDELYSLLILEDMELDEDYDGKLTAAELKQLDGFDLNWVQGFDGDLFLTHADAAIKLSGPIGVGTRFENGQIITSHFRSFDPQDGVTIRAYDPTYYTAYDLGGGVRLPNRCEMVITPADLPAAYDAVEEALYGQPADPDSYPEVGDKFADTVRVTCAGG